MLEQGACVVEWGERAASVFPEDHLSILITPGAADQDRAIELVERAELAESLAQEGTLDGVVYVDGRYGETPPEFDRWGSYESGEWNMWGTRLLFEELGWYPVVWDSNSQEFGEEPVGSDDGEHDQKQVSNEDQADNPVMA